MKCKSCKREIDDDSIYCKYCGERQIRAKRQKKSTVSVPDPRQLPSGMWNVYLRKEGQSVTETTKEKCRAKAAAIRAGFIEAEAKRKNSGLTIGAAIDKYISDNANILSPSTLRGYKTCRDNRFQSIMDEDLRSDLDWKSIINDEAQKFSPKTLSNSWRLITAVMRANGVAPPLVKLPKVPKAERPWLDYDEVLNFVSCVKDTPCELAALLALHSLRRSEILALTKSSIDFKNNTITVRGSVVYDKNNNLVHKDTNKSASSQRIVPIVIPRLTELLQAAPDGQLVTVAPNTIYRRINSVCADNGLPLVGVHGLRHSFASLAYHLGWSEASTMSMGGWSDPKVVHEIYTHLSQKDRSKDIKKMQRFYKSRS